MSYKSMFFDAVDVGEEEYDRVYEAADFAEYFSRFIGNGVFASPLNGLKVSSSGGMAVSIAPGYAWINGYMFSVISGSTESLTLPVANATLNRYDSIVLGLNYTDRQITPYVKSGSLANNPTPATLTRDSSLYEIELATVYVAAGVSQVSQANITDKRPDNTRCGYVAALIKQLETAELFDQFTAIFNAWLADLQDTLDDNVAANLLSRIQNLESNQSKMSYGSYSGQGSATKYIETTFTPYRVLIDAVSSLSYSSNTIYYKHTLDIIRTGTSSYQGIYTRQGSDGNILVKEIEVSLTSNAQTGNPVLSIHSDSSTHSANQSGISYCFTAWGV